MSPSLLLVNSTDLSQWAQRRDAQALLPQLIRRLILATTPSLDSISFRADEGVQLGGWDGVVTTNAGSGFVPTGLSAWELGVDVAVKKKADADYAKRTNDPLQLDQKSTTYVFVTLRRWKPKSKWSDDKRKQGIWKDVRAYDADDLATWLELAPAVHLWISKLLGKHLGSAEDLASFWEAWAAVTKPPLTEFVVTAGRGTQVSGVLQWLAGEPAVLALRGETAEEAIAFLAGSVMTLPSEERERALTRAIVVRDIADWQVIVRAAQPLVLVPVFSDRERTPAAIGLGHHVLLPQGRNEGTAGLTIELERVRTADAEAALKALGLQEVDELAPLARASLSALRRKLAIHPASLTPKWAQPSIARALLPAVLIGRWSEDSEGDQKVISELANIPYQQYRPTLDQWASEPDPPLRKIGRVWTVVARNDAWALLSRVAGDADLEKLENIAHAVLSEVDPKFELPANERVYAPLRGKVHSHSATLREAVADTLAIIASSSDLFPLSTISSGQAVVDRMMTGLYERLTTSEHWASISDELRLLAEASPDVFLDAVAKDLKRPAPLLVPLFATNDSPFTSSPYVGLLWALETLAWSSQHLSRAAKLLATLERIAPRTKLSNRPIRSLTEIFLLWHPSTLASLQQRLVVVDQLRQHEPETAWSLMAALIPKGMGVASSTAKPQRRNWNTDRAPVTHGEMYKGTIAILKRIREDVGSNGQRWQVLIDALDDLPESEYDSVLDQLNQVDPNRIPNQDRLWIFDALRKQLARHREFPDAEWALSAQRIEQLDELYRRFQPLELEAKYAWLFRPGAQLPESGLDWQAQASGVERAQEAAAAEAWAAGGLERLIALAREANEPGRVGNALGRGTAASDQEHLLIAATLGSDDPIRRAIALGFLGGRRFSKGLDWANAIRASELWTTFSAHQRADYYSTLAASPETFAQVESDVEDVRREYWTNHPTYGHGDLDRDGIALVASRFIDYHHPGKALDFLAAIYHTKKDKLDPTVVVRALESARDPESRDTPADWMELGYDIARLLDFVDEAKAIAPEQLGSLEWFFLPLVRNYRPSRALHRLLSSTPEFFIEVLSLGFRARNSEHHAADDQQRARALVAWELLENFRRLPGTRDDGSVDADAFRDWVMKARALAAQCDRAEIADQKIGELLSAAPPGEDGIWPPEYVRDVIEAADSDDIDLGVSLGVYNSRGIVKRGLREGGKQERALASKYRKYVAPASVQWPRTERILKSIADRYAAEALRVDDRVDVEEDLWASRRPFKPSPRVSTAGSSSLSVRLDDDAGTDSESEDE